MQRIRLFLSFMLLLGMLNVNAQNGCWKMVSCGNMFTVAIKNDGTLWAWGMNSSGQLGDGTSAIKYNPVQISTATNWQTISAGSFHTSAIKSDGTLWAWGLNTSGELGDGTTVDKNIPIQIGVESNWKTVSSGGNHTLALKVSGTLWAWGYNSSGELGDGTTVSKTVPTQVGTATDWQTISAGTSHSKAIKTNGSLWSWGVNSNGQLGDGTTVNKNIPTQIVTASTWQFVYAALNHSIAIKTDGSLWTWGYNNSGQLGDGTTTTKTTPTKIGTATNWKSASGAVSHTIAIKTDSTLWAWGNNSSGQLGDGTTINKTAPIQIGVATNWKQISVGDYHSGGVKLDGSLSTTGSNVAGSLGNGTNVNSNVFASINCPITVVTFIINSFSPTTAISGVTIIIKGKGFTGANAVSLGSSAAASYKVINDSTIYAVVGSGTTGIVSVSTSAGTTTKSGFIYTTPCWKKLSPGYYHTLGIKQDGSLWAWGWNGWGQLGDGTFTNKTTPVKVSSNTNWQSISGGSNYSFAIKNDGTLWAWGRNDSGQLGDGTFNSKNIITQIGVATNWKIVSAGLHHTMAIKTDGTLWAWGSNEEGQLGDGTIIKKNTPVQIGSANNWSVVYAGFWNTFAIKTDGTLWGWGNNINGQLGDGTTISKKALVQIGTATNWSQISITNNHCIGLKTDGTIWVWGDNTYGQLGDGSNLSKYTPTKQNSDIFWQSISAGWNYSIMINKDGGMWAFGYNLHGTLGDGTNINKNVPTRISASNSWYNVMVNNEGVFAIKSDGSLLSWGYNDQGQLGDGTTTDKNIPSAITCPVSSCLIVAGNLISPNSKSIKNVLLNVTGGNSYSKIFSSRYVDSCSSVSSITIRPTKNNDITKANGVTSIDALLTQRHILNVTKLNSPYKTIAADVNGDKAINSVDVLRIKRLILGTDSTFTSTTKGNRLWEFVDSAYTFPDTTNPFPFKDSISFTNLTSNKINQTFIGVKLGDVNYDWNPTVARGASIDNVELIIDKSQWTIDNGQLKIPIKVKNFKEIAAMQYTLHFDNSKFELVGIENNKLNIDFNEKQATTTGNIAMLWTDKTATEKTLDDGTELFVLVLRAKEFGTRNLELGISDAITDIAAWDKDFNQHNIVLTKREKPQTTNIEQWTIYPNPTKGLVNLYVETLVGKGNIVIADVYGKQVKTQPLNLGTNTVNIANLSKGIYFVSIITSEGKTTKKLVVE